MRGGLRSMVLAVLAGPILLVLSGCGSAATPGTVDYLESRYKKLPGKATKAEAREIMGKPDVDGTDAWRYKAKDGEMTLFWHEGFLVTNRVDRLPASGKPASGKQ